MSTLTKLTGHSDADVMYERFKSQGKPERILSYCAYPENLEKLKRFLELDGITITELVSEKIEHATETLLEKIETTVTEIVVDVANEIIELVNNEKIEEEIKEHIIEPLTEKIQEENMASVIVEDDRNAVKEIPLKEKAAKMIVEAPSEKVSLREDEQATLKVLPVDSDLKSQLPLI